ncbi:hypothetical protein ACWCWD_33870 [Streptomyces sp. NPDC001493]
MRRPRGISQSAWLKLFGATGVVIGLTRIPTDRDIGPALKIALFTVGCVALVSAAWHTLRASVGKGRDRGESG